MSRFLNPGKVSDIPAPHREFLNSSVQKRKDDERLLGVAVGGSFIESKLDEYSDLDLIVIVSPDRYHEVLKERTEIVSPIGPLLESFTWYNKLLRIWEISEHKLLHAVLVRSKYLYQRDLALINRSRRDKKKQDYLMTQLIIAFLVSFLGFGMIHSFFKQRRFISLTGKVIDIDDSKVGYYQAIIQIPDHDQITVQYKDSDTYELGQEVNCMWDGKNEITVSNDFRRSLFFGGLIAIAIGIYLVLQYFLWNS